MVSKKRKQGRMSAVEQLKAMNAGLLEQADTLRTSLKARTDYLQQRLTESEAQVRVLTKDLRVETHQNKRARARIEGLHYGLTLAQQHAQWLQEKLNAMDGNPDRVALAS